MTSTTTSDPLLEQLLASARPRALQALPRRERLSEAAFAAAMLAAVAALLAWGPHAPAITPATALGLVACYAVAARVRFRVGAGTTAPTQLVLMPMLLLAPPWLVPLLAAGGMLVARLPDWIAGRSHPDRALLVLPDAWHAVAPAAVIALAGSPTPSIDELALYAAAFAAQVVFDVACGILRERAALGAPPRLALRLLFDVTAADAALTPIGVLAGIVAVHNPAAVLLVLPLVALLAVFARQREQHITQALELSSAYRGTALLLGDLLEADDAYTGGEHSRGVVELSMAVGEEMGVSGAEARDLEFAALLHDIGKIHVPGEILNKPGPLSDHEWEIVKRHPAAGQRMLDRVGGRLSGVGAIVRAHHERVDGTGYPDGLTGERIPLAARIIAVCDAYSAMTTTRSYRRALEPEDAMRELIAGIAAQFDGEVVAALASVLGRR